MRRNNSMDTKGRYETIERYCKARNAAVAAAVEHGDLVPLRLLCRANGLPNAGSDAVLLRAAHKMCCNITAMPESLQEKSRKWLEEHGSSADIG